MKKLALITTHPIQYNAPFFKLLTERGQVQLKVFYTWPQAIEGFEDPDFGTQIKWDIPLLEGYDWEAVNNVAKSPSSKSYSGIDCPELISRIESFSPDAVMVYGWNLKSHFKAMRYFKGKVPLWFFGDSTLLDEKPGWKKLLRRLWLTWVYRHIDKAFFVGTNNKNYFLAHGVNEDKLVHFPHAIDNDRFVDNAERQYEQKARQWRRELGFGDQDLVVLFAGKLESKKSPLIILEAIQQINNSTHDQINLLFVGNGSLEQSLKEKAKGDEHIKFLPFQNQSLMPLVYRLGEVFCLPSQGPGETWGLAVNEAMACARPIIVSDKVGCAIDLVKENETGIIVEADHLLALVEALSSFVDLNLEDKGSNCVELISDWSYDKKAKAIEDALRVC